MGVDHPTPGPSEPAPSGWLRRVSPTTWLLVAVTIYFVVSITLSWLRSVELQTTTWDEGIYQQALWSAAHGRNFFETADLETGGYRSLLQVHTVFLLYLLAPLYAALPYEATLFVVQSLVVAAAAIPLYLLTRDLTRSSWLGLVSAVAYLVWTPTLSSNLYDFHAESFLPLELIVVVLLWERGRYLAGGVAVAISFATLELAPVLLFFVGLFFLLPSRETWQRWRNRSGGRFPWTTWVHDLRPALSSPRVRASLALVGGCVAVYFLLVYLRLDVLNPSLGVTPLPNAPTGYVIGGTPSALGLSFSNVPIGFYYKITYWVVIAALLGFVPLLSPRALLLSVPWFGFTMLSSNLNYVTLGFQYGFIAGGPLLVAFAYGLPRAVVLLESLSATLPRLANVSSLVPPSPRAAARAGRPRGLFVAGFVVFLAVNLALSPVDPLLQNQGLGSAYRVSYSPPAGFENVEQLAALVPSGATVIASDNLFPLVANDENAYTLSWVQDNFLALPFNSTHLPQYMLLAENRTYAVPAWLTTELYAPSAFGVRAVVWSSIAGAVLLFESGYTGPLTTYGTGPSVPFSVSGASLVDAEAGYATTVPGSPGAPVAASVPGALGTLFYGPSATLPTGTFTITLLVNASAIPGEPPPAASEPTLWIGASAYAQAPYFGWSLPFSAFSPDGWTAVTFNVSFPGPTVQFSVQGVVLGTNVQAFLETLEVVPARGAGG